MPWPPAVLPINRTNALTQNNNHPTDHNAVNQAVNDTVAQVAALSPLVVRQFATVADLKAFAPADGVCAVVLAPVGYGVLIRSGGVWQGERVFGSSSATDTSGIFTITAAVAGFATVVHADVLTAKGFPGAGQLTNAGWARISNNNVEVMVFDLPAGTPALSRSVTYTARVRGYL